MNVAELIAQLSEAATKAAKTKEGDSNKPVCMLEDETGEVFETLRVEWDPTNDCFFVHVQLDETDEDEDEDD